MLQTIAHLVKVDSIHSSNKVHVEMDMAEKKYVIFFHSETQETTAVGREDSFKYVSVVFHHRMSLNLIVGCSSH